PPDEMGVGQYRMIGPLKELTDSGRICSFLLPALSSEKRFLPYVSELIRAKPTVFFLQNAFSDFHLDDLQHYAELLPDIFRVFGQDDIVFSIPQKSAARKHFGKDTKARVRKAASLCHRAIVTTEPIAEAMRGMVDDIRVVPNSLERSRWGDLQPLRNERRKLRVGWAGAQQHQGDLEFILPVVEATANEVDWIFMGMCPPKLRYHVAEAHNAVHFAEYPAALAALDLDLAIAPLELNRFNTAKSNLRLLEYGAVGYPVIATDILPYRNAPVTRVPNNPNAWIDAIRAHVHDLDATRAAGEQLREWVLSNWMLDQHLDEWLKALLPD
ncbi:MAG: glycosyltransferase family 1 protein, partial [Candidatus Competibacteraceae bacterium]